MVDSTPRYIVQVFVGSLSPCYEALSVEACRETSSEEIVACIVEKLNFERPRRYELVEVVGDRFGKVCKEQRLRPHESPVEVMLLWPSQPHEHTVFYKFCLREKNDSIWTQGFSMDPQLLRDCFNRYLYEPGNKEYPDLCQLPDLNEKTLLDNLRTRFEAEHIYTYVGSILIAVNPFKFHPIYNPKYVGLYQNQRLGMDLPPHIFAVADAAYQTMLKQKKNQCIVISGESGSGKTESTNFLLHHLTALSQKGSHGSGVEQTILSAGPVLEAFGNAKTAHNNNSSRFGKFIQVNYKENGMVHGAVVQKYLLEKSRICSQGENERNYHVFYYLIAGTTDEERQQLHLQNVESYSYLNRTGCSILANVDDKHEFTRLKKSMETVGFTSEKQKRLFAVLSAVLLIGNVEFQRKSGYHHDEAVSVKNPDVVQKISELLRVKQETLMAALTAKRARASGETLVINYKHPEAIAARDAIAKCLYGALFDWIVLQVNHALLSKKDTLKVHQGNSIGVLDIFGFEDFGLCNSFEQFCINYANEHLQHYFNQHVFKYEQELYKMEGIEWSDINFSDNSGCLQLIEGKPNGLLCMLDDHCSFPGATNEALLQKFNIVNKNNQFYDKPQKKENAFIVKHYAGGVKYQVEYMREKNLDQMRQDIVSVLKNSSMAFVRELVGADPVAVFRWAILRAFFRAYFAFNEAGTKSRLCRDGSKCSLLQQRYRGHSPNDNLIKYRQPVVKTSIKSFNQIHDVSDESGYGLADQQCQLLVDNNKNYKASQLESTRRSSTLSASTNNYAQSTTAKATFSTTKNRNILDTDGDVVDCSKFDRRNDCFVKHHTKLYDNDAAVFEKASRIVMKNKSFRPRDKGKKSLKNLESVKTLAGRTQSYANALSGKARKQPLTVSAQFQLSLHSLMETLNQSNPYFIRCIKSNKEKVPNLFDEETVQRQLRYTGMLETVRIRQAGYSVRFTYEEFIQHHRIILPNGRVSSRNDIREFLKSSLETKNYQLGKTKIFMRESERAKLESRMHQQILRSILVIQKFFEVLVERRRFLRLKDAVTTLQSWWRMIRAQRLKNRMRVCNNTCNHSRWKEHSNSWYKKLCTRVVNFQAHARGYLYRTGKSRKKNYTAQEEECAWISQQQGLDDFDNYIQHTDLIESSQTVSTSELNDADFNSYSTTELGLPENVSSFGRSLASGTLEDDSPPKAPIRDRYSSKKHSQNKIPMESKKIVEDFNTHSDSEVDEISLPTLQKRLVTRKPLLTRTNRVSSEQPIHRINRRKDYNYNKGSYENSSSLEKTDSSPNHVVNRNSDSQAHAFFSSENSIETKKSNKWSRLVDKSMTYFDDFLNNLSSK